MGALAGLGQSIAQGFAGGATDAAGLARSSMGWGAASTLLGTAGSLASGIGGYQQANFAAQVATQNANAATIAGGINASSSKMKFGALEHEQVANFAANGVGVGSEAVKATTNTTETLSNIDANLIQYNASREAFGERASASMYKRAATGALIGGVFGAGNAFLTGASGLSSKWLQYKQSFGEPSSSSPYDYATMGA